MGDCKLWDKSLNNMGYGQMWYLGKLRKAHRVVYCIANNVSSDSITGKVVRHKCDTPACVNPEHLELGTCVDNSKDMVLRGRSHKPNHHGENHPNHKLSAEDVLYIRKHFIARHKVYGGRALARKFGVGNSTIYNVLNNHSWSIN